MKWRRVKAVTRKELLHIVRDVRSLALALMLPMVMLLLFGYALSLDVDRIPAVVYDRDQSPESRALIQQFTGSRYFELQHVAANYRGVEREIDSNRALLAIVVPERFSQDLLAGRLAKVQLLFDGSDSNTASIAAGYAQAVVQAYATQLRIDFQTQRGAPKIPIPVEPQIRVLYNEEMKSKNFIVPGLIAVIIMIISALLTSLTIAREWENGTMEQLLSTPVRPMELVLGKLAAYFVVGLADMLVSLAIGVFVFDVPLKGSVLLLFATSAVFLAGALCWGIFISAATRNQLLANQLGMLTSFLPAFLLSGFIYSVENMPTVIQIISRIVPARYFIVIIKGIFLKGIGIQVLGVEILLLCAYGALVFWAASRRMRQKVA
jgi:ABC-2 type transport system permease protein